MGQYEIMWDGKYIYITLDVNGNIDLIEDWHGNDLVLSKNEEQDILEYLIKNEE